MNPVDHAVIEAAVKAKKLQQQQPQQQGKTPPQASTLNKAITTGIWVAAAGSLVAVALT